MAASTASLFLCTLLAAFLIIRTEKSIRVQKFICTSHDNRTLQDVKCFSKSVNRSLKLINADGFLLRPITSISINAGLYKKDVVTYKPFLVNVTENLCNFLGRNRGGVYMRALARLFLPYSNINHACPYSGHIYVRNMPLKMNEFLLIWPAGEYRLDLVISDEYVLGIVVQVFYEIK